MRTGKITLTIESRFENVFLVGLAVNRITSSISLSEQLAFEMEVAAVEAVNNAVEHAHHHQANKRITVRVQLNSDHIQFTIVDRGEPIDFERVMSGSTPAASTGEPERGRGLKIIKGLMDEVRYKRKGATNQITLVKYLKRA
ncbi:MAG: ATP-binding protein [Candidatus Binataceae bacterium]